MPEPRYKEIIKPLCQVTPLSKYFAMILFIALPFVGGYVGYVFAPGEVVEVEKVVIQEVEVEEAVQTSRQPDSRNNVLDQTNPDQVDSSKQFVLPGDIVKSAPINCLPQVPDEVAQDKAHFYATQIDVDLMKVLVVGKTYGSFIYEGYVCSEKYSEGLNQTLNAPTLYFSGAAEFTGNDIFTEYGGLEHFKIQTEDIEKLPELTRSDFWSYPSFKYVSNRDVDLSGSTYDVGDTYGKLGATTTLVVDGLTYGQVGGGYQSYYGGVIPSVISVDLER